MQLTRAAAGDPAARRRGIRRDRQAGRLEDARREGGGHSASPSTVRAELAELESLGLLTHPHTSAGRVPTESGYRYYADELLRRLDPQPAEFPLDLHTEQHRGRGRAPGDDRDALAGDAAARARLGSAARGDDGRARRGAAAAARARDGRRDHVRRRRHEAQLPLRRAGRPGPRQVGRRVPQRDGRGPPARHGAAAPPLRGLRARRRASVRSSLRSVPRSPSSSRRSSGSTSAAPPTCSARCAPRSSTRTATCSSSSRSAPPCSRCSASRTLEPRRPFVRVGHELEHPALPEIALVGACYGLVHRALGAVSLVGPVRMDYEKALGAVRSAASELSRVRRVDLRRAVSA